MAAETIAIVNFKGGVGKTTLAVNLAVGLANRDVNGVPLRVLIVDGDAQSNASSYMLGQKVWERTIYPNSSVTLSGLIRDFLAGDAVDSRQAVLGRKAGTLLFANGPVSWPNLHLLPAHFDLALLENQIHPDESGMIRIAGRASGFPASRILQEILGPLTREYDYIVLDCPPNMYQVARGIMNFSDNFLVPVVPDWLSSTGLIWFLKALSRNIPGGKSVKKVRGIVPMLWDEKWTVNKEHKQRIVDAMSDKWEKNPQLKEYVVGWKIFNGIPRLAEVAGAIDTNRPFLDHPNNKPALNLKELTDHILGGWQS